MCLKNKLQIAFILIGVFLFSSVSWAAPIPATSSSLLIDSENGTFRSHLGFQISAGQSDWILSDAPNNHKYIAIQYKSPSNQGGVRAALTVRIDELSQSTNLRSYVKKWIRDYPKLGFDILAARKVSVDEKPAFLIDLINRESSLQLRQVVFLKKQRAVILTCRDHKERFLENLKSCNQIIRSFDWTLPESDNRQLAVQKSTKSRLKK